MSAQLSHTHWLMWKLRRPYNPQLREGLGLCSTLYCWDNSEQMIGIFVITTWHILYSQVQCLPVQCPEWTTDLHKYMPQTFDELALFQCLCEAHETLSLLFAMDGILLAWIFNNAEEMIQGKFHQKLKDTGCHLKQLGQYTPNPNSTEWEIKELKK